MHCLAGNSIAGAIGVVGGGVVIGVVGGLNIGVLNEGRRRMKFRDQVIALCGSSLHSNHSKLSDIPAGKLSVKSQFIANNFNNAMAFEWPQSYIRGFHKVRKSSKEIQCAERKCIGPVAHFW